MIRRALLVAIAALSLLTTSGHAGPINAIGSCRHDRASAADDPGASRAPRTTSPLLATISAVRPLTRQQTALPVIAERLDEQGARWLRVRLPGRPNGRAGWIRATSVRRVSSPWRLVVIRARREVLLLKNGRLVEQLRVVVGAPATPTPRGQFFVVEHVAQATGSPLGRWALATSASFERPAGVRRRAGPDRPPRAERPPRDRTSRNGSVPRLRTVRQRRHRPARTPAAERHAGRDSLDRRRCLRRRSRTRAARR